MDNKFLVMQAALTPAQVIEKDNPVCIYIDAIRASATMVTFFEKGIKRIRLCMDEVDILKRDASIDRSRYIVCAEDVPGGKTLLADCSPAVVDVQAMENVAGKTVLFHTTNGALGIIKLFEKNIRDVFVGTVLNLDAVVSCAMDKALHENRPLCIVDSGRHDCTIATLDDAYCTAKIAQKAIGELEKRKIPYELMDPIKIVLHLLPGFKDTFDAYKQSSTAIKCAANISEEDVRLCAQENVSKMVPYVSGIDDFGCVVIEAKKAD